MPYAKCFAHIILGLVRPNKSQRKLDVVRKLEIRVEKQTFNKMPKKLKTYSSHSSGNELTGPFDKGTQGIPQVEGNGHLYVFETWVSSYHCSPYWDPNVLVNRAEISLISPIPMFHRALY